MKREFWTRTGGRSPHRNRCSNIGMVLLSGGLLALGGCMTAPSSMQQSLMQSPTVPTAVAQTSTGATPAAAIATSPTPAATSPAISANAQSDTRTTTVTIYKADDQCLNYVPQQVQVPADRPIEAAVGKVLGIEGNGAGEFDMAGYRVSVNEQTGVATVDLRMNPASKRGLVSLSVCEQFALFGSLRETLIKNPQWQIKTVRFTERGQEIVL